MSRKSECDKKALREMIDIFYPNDMLENETCYDWMGYEINEANFLTYHHITKAATLRSNNISDDATLDNGACLGNLSHSALHFIEKLDKELYDLWNDVFLLINKTRKLPDGEMMERIRVLQERSSKVLDGQEEKKSRRSRK